MIDLLIQEQMGLCLSMIAPIISVHELRMRYICYVSEYIYMNSCREMTEQRNQLIVALIITCICRQIISQYALSRPTRVTLVA